MKQDSKIKFIDGYWGVLADHGFISLILHDWKRIPHNVVSDIDYVVAGPGPKVLIRILDNYCREAGWRLVQILEHEVNSLCCICFQQEAPFESVSLDVTWDYRRKGIDLISNAVLIEGAWRPPDKAFHVPAPKVEFLYRLVKAAAKDKSLKDQDELLDALHEIFQGDPDGVNELLMDHAGVRITPRNDRESFLVKVDGILGSDYFSRIREGRSYGLGEIFRRVRRGLQPTGLLVRCGEGMTREAREEVFVILREAFRTFERMEAGGKWVGDWMAKRRSVLMLRAKAGQGSADLIVQDKSAEEISRQILSFLAERIKRRWKLK